MTRLDFLGALVMLVLAGARTPIYGQTTDQATRLFETMELELGMTVADIGAGDGDMTVEMSKRLGPKGRVYSTELNPNRLADIRERRVG